MRAAPAVAVRCTGGKFWCALQLGLPAVAAAAFAAWGALGLAAGDGAAALAAGLAGAGAAALAWPGARPRPVALQWDGQRWTADGAPGRLQLMVDPGFLLLLRLHLDAGGQRWLAVAAAEAGPAWPALRAAVYSRPPRATPRVLTPERVAD